MRFRSTILEPDGSTAEATLEAADEHALHAQLFEQGRTLLRVRAVAAPPVERMRPVALSQRRLLLLTQALQEALDAGVPLLGTFAAIAEQEDDVATARLLRDLGERVAAGQPLSDALAAHPRAFSPIYTALVRAGEQSGSLPDVLQSIGAFLEWRASITGTVRQAMIYPLVVAVAGYGLVMFLLSFVLPRLSGVLAKLGGDLPAASRMLVAVSDFVAAHVGAILLATLAAVLTTWLALRSQAARQAAAQLLATLPVSRRVVRAFAVAQFARTIGVLLNAGLTMTHALQLGAASVSLPELRQRIEAARDRIVRGARLAEALRQERVLAPVALTMVQVGEEAGRLPITFERLSRTFDREVKEAVARALALLEPAVTVALGLVVGGVAVLVVVTIYSAMQGIGR